MTTLSWNLLLVLVVHSERERETDCVVQISLCSAATNQDHLVSPFSTLFSLPLLFSLLHLFLDFFFSSLVHLPVWVMAIFHYLVWNEALCKHGGVYRLGAAIGVVQGLLNCAVVEWMGVSAEVWGLREVLICHCMPILYACTVHMLWTCICIRGYLWVLCMKAL